MFHTTLYGAFMKASQVAANPYRAAALIDDLTDALNDLLHYAEKVTATTSAPQFVSARAMVDRANGPDPLATQVQPGKSRQT